MCDGREKHGRNRVGKERIEHIGRHYMKGKHVHGERLRRSTWEVTRCRHFREEKCEREHVGGGHEGAEHAGGKHVGGKRLGGKHVKGSIL